MVAWPMRMARKCWCSLLGRFLVKMSAMLSPVAMCRMLTMLLRTMLFCRVVLVSQSLLVAREVIAMGGSITSAT